MKTEANTYFINFFQEYLPTLRGYVFSMEEELHQTDMFGVVFDDDEDAELSQYEIKNYLWEQGLGCVFRVLPLIDELEDDIDGNQYIVSISREYTPAYTMTKDQYLQY